MKPLYEQERTSIQVGTVGKAMRFAETPSLEVSL
jgi:hypothetical protein